MSGHAYTASAMIGVVRKVKSEAERRAPRAGQGRASALYEIEALQGVLETLEWLALHEQAVSRAAKDSVPWRRAK